MDIVVRHLDANVQKQLLFTHATINLNSIKY